MRAPAGTQWYGRVPDVERDVDPRSHPTEDASTLKTKMSRPRHVQEAGDTYLV
jgi:hypothetical protein